MADKVKGTERETDLPWSEKKVKIFKALKVMKAFNQDSAQSSSAVAEKAGVSQKDVRHYCYAAQASDTVAICRKEDVTGYSFYLSTKGRALDPDKELKKQELEKVKAKKEPAEAKPKPKKEKATSK